MTARRIEQQSQPPGQTTRATPAERIRFEYPTAIAEWVPHCDQDVLARLGCPFDPFAGRFRAPGERTLRDVFARVDPGALTTVGFARLAAVTGAPADEPGPDGHLHAQKEHARYLVEDRGARRPRLIRSCSP